MKKFLAILLALSLVFAFAACGAKEETKPEENTEASTEAPAESSEAPTETATEAPSESATETTAESTTETTTEAAKGLNSTDAKEVVAFYNKAAVATRGKAPAGQSTMTLASLDGGKGAAGNLISSFEGIAKSALEKNSTATDYIPAADYEDVRVSDVKNATASSDGKYTTITFDVVDETVGPDAKGSDGTVGRTIGILDGVQTALDELPGVSVEEGLENVKLTYDNAKVTCKIDEDTGLIVGGTWQYKVNVNISSITLKVLILKAKLSDVKAAVDYKVVVG